MARVFFKFRGLLMLPPVVFVLTSTWGEIEAELLVWGPAGALFLAGFLLRLWAQIHLHFRLKVRRALTTTGPYRFTRNPIYIANTLLLLSAACMSELVWFCPLMLAYALGVYALVVRHEEARLRRRYGAAYGEYCRQVPRWLPRLRGPRSPAVPAWRAFLWPSLRAEAHTLLLLAPFILKDVVADMFGG